MNYVSFSLMLLPVKLAPNLVQKRNHDLIWSVYLVRVTYKDHSHFCLTL